jgi:hypothetical protein
MKAYRQFLKELPSKKVVFALGAFQPPTQAHELLIKAVDKISEEQNAAKFIYASSDDKSIPADRKMYYLKRMFPEATFKQTTASSKTLVEVAKELNKRYNNAIMVAGSDQIADYKRILEKHNGKDFKFDTITVVSAGDKDPDLESAKLKQAIKNGDFETFKESMPHNLMTVDARRLMNEMRVASGAEPLKEQVSFTKDWLRESYFRGEIYHIGDLVESNGQRYEIVDRGSNYLVVVNEQGVTSRKFLQDVCPLQEGESIVGDMLQEMKFSPSDKLKVARIVATALGVQNVDSTSNPESLLNNALRFIRNKPMRPEYALILKNMLKTAREAGINYDERLVPRKVNEEVQVDEIPSSDVRLDRTGRKIHARRIRFPAGERYDPKVDANDDEKDAKIKELRQKLKRRKLGEEVIAEEEDALVRTLTDLTSNPAAFDTDVKSISTLDHISHVYDDHELVFHDEHDTHKGKKPEKQKATPPSASSEELGVSSVKESIDRMERMKRKQRWNRTKSKREQRKAIAIKKASSLPVLTKRAHRLALHIIKSKILKKDVTQASVQEKERVERIIKNAGPLIKRLQSRLLPKIRDIEKSRLHKG